MENHLIKSFTSANLLCNILESLVVHVLPKIFTSMINFGPRVVVIHMEYSDQTKCYVLYDLKDKHFLSAAMLYSKSLHFRSHFHHPLLGDSLVLQQYLCSSSYITTYSKKISLDYYNTSMDERLCIYCSKCSLHL